MSKNFSVLVTPKEIAEIGKIKKQYLRGIITELEYYVKVDSVYSFKFEGMQGDAVYDLKPYSLANIKTIIDYVDNMVS